VHACPYAGL